MLRFFGLLAGLLALVSGFYNIGHEYDTVKEEETAPTSGEEGPDNSAVGCHNNGDAGLRYFAPGDTWWEGCSECSCRYNGTISCSNKPCCLYVAEDGSTARAMAYEAYSDGCNACRCLAEGGMGACTKKLCPDMCSYRNWDMRRGYTHKGTVKAYDEKDRCNKECRCVHRRKKDLMVVKCPNEDRKCIAY